MGADGCAWMRWGAWGMGGTQTRQEGGIYGRAGQDLVPMAGEISPDIMFLGGWQKVVWMGAGAHIAVWMGADGCRGKGKGKKQSKKNSKWARTGCFMRYAHSAKKWQGDRHGYGDQRGPRGAIEGEEGVHSARRIC